MAKKQFIRALANVQKSGRALRRDRESDFRVTSGVVDAIFGNLATTANGIGQTLGASNRRQTAALRAIARRTARDQNIVMRGAVSDITNAYGAGFEGIARQDLGVAKATLVKKAQDAAAASDAGGAIARSGKDMMGILGSGIQEAKYAANYATAQALNYRAKNDEQLVAQMTHDVQMARLQAQLDFSNWKKQQEYMQNLEEGKGGAGYQGMTLVAEHMSTASPKLRAMFAENPDANVGDVVQEYVQKYGVSNENEIQALTALASSIKAQGIYKGSGNEQPGYDREVDAVMDSLLTLYPNFRGHRKDLEKLVVARLKVLYNMSDQDAQAAAAQAVAGTTSEGVAWGRSGRAGYLLPPSS